MKSRRSKDWTLGFTQGYVCAVANIIRLHDHGVVAKDVLRQVLPVDWKSIDEHDRETIRESKILSELWHESRHSRSRGSGSRKPMKED